MKDEQIENALSRPVESSSALNQTMNKFMLGIKDDSKIQRKNALESIKKQLNEFFKNTENASVKFTDDSIKQILKNVLNIFNDPIEKCREISCEILKILIEKYSEWNSDMTGMVIMTFFQRLGAKEIKEPSEEIRLQMFNLLYELTELKSQAQKNTFEIHLQELIAMLINSFSDNYPEVKKTGCSIAKVVSNRLASSNFHMQSESLVKPLLSNIVHQHSRVRKDIIECLCDVIMNGNNKPVSDAVSHLAQRLFDQNNLVRMAVIKLVGTWLLDLPDRYSFHNKLIPLLITGFIDETPDIKELTESLWWDVGIKYEKENEKDLKDKLDFLERELPNYPSEFKDRRPNVGCRELIRLNASKIFPGILNDIGDWVEATRIKSIQLLYIMIWQAEKNTTQHLETILQTLFKASSENIQIIQDYIFNCSRLIGIFTDADVSLQIAFKTIKKMNSHNNGAISILNGLLVGFGHEKLTIKLVLECLELLNEICLNLDSKLSSKILDSCSTLEPFIKNTKEEIDDESKNRFEYLIFKTVFTISSLANDVLLKEKSKSIISNLNQDHVEKFHLVKFLSELKLDCESWTDNSFEPIIFASLIKEFGLSSEILDHVMFVLKTTLDPSKDVQMRTRFLLMIPEVFPSNNKDMTTLELCFEDILTQMILPNIAWKAGRSASAVRMTACATLVLIFQTESVKTIKIKDTNLDKLLKTMLSCLDDDNKSTRLYVSRIFLMILNYYGKILDKDQLHKLYTEFIKRLDDQSDEIRMEILKVFFVYFECLNQDYDKILYQAHLQAIYENLLLYLDDSNIDFQLKIFNLLKHGSVLNTELLLKEIGKVKAKHRNTKYCEDLEQHCQAILK
ncbi:unnamed protein product [Brachionus calyciflorus]|uniref:Uncharacterized protein n=1 Tax=Brachionus calyciflorus TaxID=104777 RepID=A0A813XJ88_9BILA|nr:unnamed protein product [Brachionus calyciflorus]